MPILWKAEGSIIHNGHTSTTEEKKKEERGLPTQTTQKKKE